MRILVAASGECPQYAAEELKKYITALSSGNICPEIVYGEDAKVPAGEETIVLAELSALGLDTSDLNDPVIEDIIDVDVTALCGYIAGSNPRSILMGVYRYCEAAGCRYIRPGDGGDYIPTCDMRALSFKYRKKADYPFRGECCEGAISYEHMRDTVYWLPKIGMNMYMIEGLVPYAYMHKWYGHVFNSKLRRPSQVTDYEMLQKYISRLERDVKRAGLQLHTLGHGWMFENFGISHKNTACELEAFSKLSPEERELLAEVKGKRELFGKSTFYTHLCYSNPKARKSLIDFIVNYAKRKPHVDYIHTWLADAANNQCECENCRKLEPSDWYVTLMNELDEELDRIGSNARIVLIAYVDTIRPPKVLKLNNPSRFLLLTAMGSFYEEGYKYEECTEPLPPYVRNDFKEFSAPLRMQCHRDWKKICGNINSVIYEYRYYVDMYSDISQMRISHETSRDMKALGTLSFNGVMSDQTHRMYMPTALPLITMGKTSFDKTTELDDIKVDYFRGAFGDGGPLVREYLEKLSVLLSPANFRYGGRLDIEEAGVGSATGVKRSWMNNPEVLERAKQIPAHLDAFLPTIKAAIIDSHDVAQRQSWVYLEYHSNICRYHGRILECGASGDIEGARIVFAELREYLSENELHFHNVFDLFLYLRAVAQKIGIPIPGYYD